MRLGPRDPFSALFYGTAAFAQFLGRNYDEATRLAHEVLSNPIIEDFRVEIEE